ncbi:MAG: hypothetical protein F2911_11190, partial [Actinobacteria bacterium]|nr:hypothetical protein [Actinomycetota bacterium]
MTIPAGRDNGLPPASRYIALVDVERSVTDHVLDLLRAAGVTAVAEQMGAEQMGAEQMGAEQMGAGPSPSAAHRERVHVDVNHALLARSVIGHALPQLRPEFHSHPTHSHPTDSAPTDEQVEGREHRMPELAPGEVESRFADIVAGFDTPSTDVRSRPSAGQSATDLPDPATGSVIQAGPKVRPPLSSRLIRRAGEAAAAAQDADTSEHFVPEPPPPLPETDRVTRMAWAALMGGPALLVLAALLGIGLESWVVVLALGGFLGGFGTLIARMRARPRQDDGWDDGAVL